MPKILVADDSVTIQKVIRLALSSEGYDIQTVSDGEDAIALIQKDVPDVVLIDYSLPKKNALEVKAQVEQLTIQSIPKFILMTSEIEPIDESEIKRAAFDGRLIKPFIPSHLKQALLSALPGSSKLEKPSPPPLRPTSAPSTLGVPEDDIRSLTDSTLKMSGLDQFEWSIEEPGKTAATSSLQEGITKFTEISDEQYRNFVSSEPVTEPPKNLNLNENVTFDFERPTLPGDQIEALVSDQLQKALEKTVEKLLPDLAEKIIRQEIHRLLADPPP